jgi:Tfp pilus assembly protein PilO
MHFKNKSLTALIVPALVFSCSALFSLLAMRYWMAPQWEALTANKAVLASFRDSIVKDTGNSLLKKQLVENRDSLKIKYDDVLRETGGARDLSGVLQMIIAKANAADIKFVKMQPQAETKSGTSIVYPMVLELTATYYSYGRFIAALETLPWVVRVERMAITVQKTGLLEIRTLVTCFIQDKP